MWSQIFHREFALRFQCAVSPAQARLWEGQQLALPWSLVTAFPKEDTAIIFILLPSLPSVQNTQGSIWRATAYALLCNKDGDSISQAGIWEETCPWHKFCGAGGGMISPGCSQQQQAGDGGQGKEKLWKREKVQGCEHAPEQKAAGGCADTKMGYIIIP